MSNINTFIYIFIFIISLLFFYFIGSSLLIINSDSVNGFIAAKSNYWLSRYNYTDIKFDHKFNTVDATFLTWWSPGQYVIPKIFIHIFSFKTGTVLLLINNISTILGVLGFATLFKHLKFKSEIIIISLILIITSITFYYNYISYQGGEILSFMFFPWFLYIILKIQSNKRWVQYILGISLILIGFFLKSSLLITSFVTYAVLFIHNISFDSNLFKRDEYLLSSYNYLKKRIHQILIFILSGLILYFTYLKKGTNPAETNTCEMIDYGGIFTSLVFPITGIGNLNNVGLKYAERFNALFFIIPILVMILLKLMLDAFHICNNYKRFVIRFLLFNSLIFIILYLKASAIDNSIRHLKHGFYLFTPIIGNYLFSINKKAVAFSFILFVFYFDFFRLKNIWNKNTYLHREKYYMSTIEKDEMPKEILEYLSSHLRNKSTVCLSDFIPRWSLDRTNVYDVNYMPPNLILNNKIDFVSIGKEHSISKNQNIHIRLLDTIIGKTKISFYYTE